MYLFVVPLAACMVGLHAYAAEISNVTITDIGANAATVKWTTDITTDATVNFGLDPSFGIVRDPLFTNKDHSLTLQNLEPSTLYHFRVQSADKDGNTSSTGGLTFTTKGDISKKIISEIDKVTDPKQIIDIEKKVQQVSGDVVKPPTILGATKVVPDMTQAEVTWTTDRESSSVVYVAPDGEYDAHAAKPYTITQGDPKDSVKKHSVTLIGLTPATTYHFKATSGDALGLIGETADDTFKTKSTLPEITNLRVTRVQETAATVSWSTGSVLAKGLVSYTNMRTHAVKSVGTPAYTTSQSINLTGLVFGTRYTAIISATNDSGDVVESKPISFITVRDVVAPAITKVNNESTLYPGDDVKIQTIVSWVTDEPATCQVFYTQGLVHSADNEGDSLPPEQNPLTNHTQVIVGFAPSMVYKFWVKCDDVAKNETQSEDFVLITPTKEKNIIDVILENFQGTFGWVNNVGK